jgi:hypothetical protein
MAVFAFLMYQTWLYDKYTHAPLPAVSPEVARVVHLCV